MTLTRVYCYVTRRTDSARLAGFPASLDLGDYAGTRTSLRERLTDVLVANGHDPAVTGRLYWLDVRDFDTDERVTDVEVAS